MTSSKQKRGFAVMDPEVVKNIASKGGKAAHKQGTAHKWTPEEASVAGRKGGLSHQRRKREKTATITNPVSTDHE